MVMTSSAGDIRAIKAERRRSMPSSASLVSAFASTSVSASASTLATPASSVSALRPPPSPSLSTPGKTSATSVLSLPVSSTGAYSVRSFRSAAGDGQDQDPISAHRLRSNSGLSLHTNKAALRRYTDYNADGSTRVTPTEEDCDPISSGESGGSGRDHASITDSISTGPDIPVSPGIPSAPDLFSLETISAVLDDSVARRRLKDYAARHGGAELLEFLERVDDYNRALDGITALLASISTTFTSATATKPLNLPSPLAKTLHADIKQVNRTILPGLEMLLGDAATHVEQLMVSDIYPAFVHHQLASCISASLGAPNATDAQTPFEFPGLGHTFCIIDPYRPNSPIVYASESFAHMTGHAKAEDVPRGGHVMRLHLHKNVEGYSESLLLSRHHGTNQPFWSVVVTCPLKSAGGRVRFMLCAVINISATMKTPEDMMHALRAEPACCHRSDGAGTALGTTTSGSTTKTRAPSTATTDSSSSSSAGPATYSAKTSKSTARSFFSAFSRKRRALTGSRPTRTNDDSAAFTPQVFHAHSLPEEPGAPPVVASTLHRARPSANLAIYARFMVLQFVPGASHVSADPAPPPPATQKRGGGGSNNSGGYSSKGTSQSGTATSSGAAAVAAAATHPAAISPPHLKIAFCAQPALELLGLELATEETIMYHDIFAVLSEHAGSPSISSWFRNTVRQKLAASESTSLELSVPIVASVGWGTGTASPASKQADGGQGATGSSSSNRHSGMFVVGGDTRSDNLTTPDSRWTPAMANGRLRKSSERPSTVNPNSAKPPPPMRRLMSHWTPLKGSDGDVTWVVLVMTPATS